MLLFGHKFIKYLIGFLLGCFYDYCTALPKSSFLSHLPTPPKVLTTTFSTHLPIF
jgi:hypothetical protein